jgi:hypothetical protein
MQTVDLAIVTMQPDRTIVGQTIAQQQETLIHKLQITIARPRIRVLHLLGQNRSGAIAQTDLPAIVSIAVEWWIDVDQAHFAPKAIR